MKDSRRIPAAVVMVLMMSVFSEGKPEPQPGVSFNIDALSWTEKIACYTNCDKCASHTSRYYSACWADVNKRNKRCGDNPSRFFFSRGSDRCYCCP